MVFAADALDVAWNGARLVSLRAGGLLADAVGIRAVHVAGGLLLFSAAVVGLGAPLRYDDVPSSGTEPTTGADPLDRSTAGSRQ